MNNKDFTTGIVADLRGDLKLRDKELKSQLNDARDAVHDELVKALRVIDQMRTVAVGGARQNPPRARAGEGGRRVGEVSASASAVGSGRQSLSQGSAAARGPSVSVGRDGSVGGTASASPAHRPPPSLPSHVVRQNRSSSSSAHSPNVTNNGIISNNTTQQPRASSHLASVVASASRGGSSSRTGSLAARSPSVSAADANVPPPSTVDLLMPTDPRLALQGLAVCQHQLDDAVQALRGKAAKPRQRPVVTTISSSPPRAATRAEAV